MDRNGLSSEHGSAGHVEQSAVHTCWVDDWTDQGESDRERNLRMYLTSHLGMDKNFRAVLSRSD